MHKRTFISLTVLMLLASGAAFAQPATGTPPFGTFSGGPVDVVNNANLNVHVQIPILNKAGRGLPFTYALSYDNSIWTKVMNNGVTSWAPASSGWAGSTNAITVDTGYVTYQTTQSQCGPNPSYYFYQYTNFSYHDSSGASHVLNPVSTTLAYVVNCLPGTYPPTSGTTTTNDGTGYTVTLQAAYNSAWATSVVNLSGLLISQNPGAGSGTNTDRNGNQLSWSTAGGTVTFTDTLNTPVLTVPSSGLLTYKDPQNGNSSYTPTWATLGAMTGFACSGVSEYSGMMTLLSSLALPDGTSYSFTYEATPGYPQYVTGRIASVTLPTGGTISYQYSGGNNGINCSDGSTPTLTRTTPDGAWTYSRSGTTTTITTPASDHTTILSQGIYEVQRNVYKGAVSPGNLLVTLDTCYNGSSSPCTGTAVSTPITQVNVITTLPGSTALKSKRLTTFDSLGNALPQETDEYDYGPGAVGSLVRKTLISYASLGNNITDMPSSVTVQDGNSATQAQTTYAYECAGRPAWNRG